MRTAVLTEEVPLMFVSSAFTPPDTMPGWMRALANVNPVSHATDTFAAPSSAATPATSSARSGVVIATRPAAGDHRPPRPGDAVVSAGRTTTAR
jgi:ABC-2 type transport system permease protein